MTVRRIELVVSDVLVAVHSQRFSDLALLVDGEQDVGLRTENERRVA